ncbi:extracellular solute-binding protein [Kosmotoga sp. DU53]|uniref:extracellular solute-binding protein n=1 Tax=Kosmotoga sp. DU53 TaxID=1310160 RepID=UPI0009EF38F9|nr:extracellular solute-binding protein [Kosmotoga sp. DU53]
MRKVLLLALVMSLLVVALGAIKISYMTFSAVPNHEETLREIAKAFEAQNQGIRVNLIFVPWSDYFLKLSTMFAGGTPPDRVRDQL